MSQTGKNIESRYPAGSAAVLVFFVGAFPQFRMHDPIPLLAERFIPGAGWVEQLLLAVYAGWLTRKLLTTDRTSPIRRTVWLAFSLIFFLQALLGISGLHRFLMSGTLHLPVPAMIIAGPIYRGSFSLFMPMLLGVTLLLAGPAWCSWFCYFGSWDFFAAGTAQSSGTPVRHPFIIRLVILATIIGGALLLRFAGAPPVVAVGAGILFGVIGIGCILFISRKRGIMVHCTAYCPIGMIATVIGKINPFRISIGPGCTGCHLCSSTCRYGALSARHLERRSPGLTCTLCGDCLSACPGKHISYRFPGLSPATSRALFIVIVVVIHSLFIGFGRI